MNELEYYGTVNENGVIHIRNRKQLTEDVKQFAGKEIELVIRKKSKHRSIQQNRYYFSCLNILSNHTGFSKDELHEIMKFKFLKTTLVDEKTGEAYEYIKSTTDLTTTEFEAYMAEIRQFASETLDCYLGEPNEQLSLSEFSEEA